MINSTFKVSNKQGYEGQLQITVNHSLLNNLMKLALNNNASAQARAVASLKMDQLKTWLSEKVKVTSPESWKAHYAYELLLINEFREDPKKYEADNLLAPPPGQPIGQDESCSWGN